MRIKPGTALRLWSDDAFGGALRSVDDLSAREGRPALRQPADRPVLRRGRRARRHPRAAPRRAGAGPRLGRLGGDPVLRRHDEHRPHRDPAGPAAGHHLDLRARPRRATPSPSPPGTATTASSCRSSRCSAPSAWRRPAARCAPRWCPTGSAATWTPRRCGPASTVFLGVNVEGAHVLHRRRALPPGRGRGLRHRRRGRDDHHADRRAGQGRRPGLAADRGRHALDDRRLQPPDGGLLADRQRRARALGRPSSTACTRWTPTSSCSQIAQVPVANVVDANYSVVVKAAKSLLPAADAFGGIHADLRARARSLGTV